jgi:hypothetical protein
MRIYNTNERKKIIKKFENIKDKTILKDLFIIITSDIKDNFSSNQNGIFINLNILKDETIKQLLEYDLKTEPPNNTKIIYKSYNKDNNISLMDRKMLKKINH